jgi:hypothetical protein
MNTDENENDQPLAAVSGHLGDTPVAPAHAIAAIALTMAMKFHDINTVQDGALYQQYKLEGKNMRPLHLDHVLETATKIEEWLLASSERIAKIVVDAVAVGMDEDDGTDDAEADGAEQERESAERGDSEPGSDRGPNA